MGRTVDSDGTTSADDGVVWDGGWDVAQGVRGRWEAVEHVHASNEGKTRRHGRAPETGCGAGTSLVALRMDPLAAHDPKHSRRRRVLVVAPYPTTNFRRAYAVTLLFDHGCHARVRGSISEGSSSRARSRHLGHDRTSEEHRDIVRDIERMASRYRSTDLFFPPVRSLPFPTRLSIL